MRTALCLGGGDTLFEDFEKVKTLRIQYHAVFACNDAGTVWPEKLDGWVTFHPEKFKKWIQERSMKGLPDAEEYFTHADRKVTVTPKPAVITSYFLPGQTSSGSSGLFTAKVALVDRGFDRVVLAGIPLTVTPHFFDKKEWRACNGFRKAWHTVSDTYKAKMRSCSGWTRVLLGGPDCWADVLPEPSEVQVDETHQGASDYAGEEQYELDLPLPDRPHS